MENSCSWVTTLASNAVVPELLWLLHARGVISANSCTAMFPAWLSRVKVAT